MTGSSLTLQHLGPFTTLPQGIHSTCSQSREREAGNRRGFSAEGTD